MPDCFASGDHQKPRSEQDVVRQRTPLPEQVIRALLEFWRTETLQDGIVSRCATLRAAAGEASPPYRLRRMLQVLSADLQEKAISTPGRLEWSRDRFVIVIKSGTPWRRNRFTIAHEIGHI